MLRVIITAVKRHVNESIFQRVSLTSASPLRGEHHESHARQGRAAESPAGDCPLRVDLFDVTRARPDRLKALGASGVMTVGGGMQAIFGTRSENLKTDIEAYLSTAGADADAPIESERRPEAPGPTELSSAPGPGIRPDVTGRAADIARALGGLRNLQTVEACAITRIRTSLVDARSIDEVALRRAGVPALMRLGPNLVHVIVGNDAAAVAAAMRELLARQPPAARR